jgi:hypothetical protein
MLAAYHACGGRKVGGGGGEGEGLNHRVPGGGRRHGPAALNWKRNKYVLSLISFFWGGGVCYITIKDINHAIGDEGDDKLLSVSERK